jgi:5-methylcytosine-specific restriction endonuclease McrA
MPRPLTRRQRAAQRQVAEIRSSAQRKRGDVLERDDYTCQNCGFDGHGRERALTVDHIQPVADGGSSKLWNLQTLCLNCNALKADSPPTLAERARRDQRRVA